MKMVDDARDAWRWISMRLYFLQGAAASSWLMVPEDMRAAVPSDWLAIAAVIMAVAGVFGRLVKQDIHHG